MISLFLMVKIGKSNFIDFVSLRYVPNDKMIKIIINNKYLSVFSRIIIINKSLYITLNAKKD